MQLIHHHDRKNSGILFMQIETDDEYTKPNVWYFHLFHDASSISHIKLRPERQKALTLVRGRWRLSSFLIGDWRIHGLLVLHSSWGLFLGDADISVLILFCSRAFWNIVIMKAWQKNSLKCKNSKMWGGCCSFCKSKPVTKGCSLATDGENLKVIISFCTPWKLLIHVHPTF